MLKSEKKTCPQNRLIKYSVDGVHAIIEKPAMPASLVKKQEFRFFC
jgi:hypothetical protein